jgi:predicted anti-sigma-YlaC factor YlaD
MTCEAWQELILDKESLADLERRELQRHLSSCFQCQAWAKALAEAEVILTEQLKFEANPSELRALVLRAVARERRRPWMTGALELLDGLGWGAVGVLAVAAFAFWTHWTTLDNHLVWMGTAAVAGSVAWAGGVLRKEDREARLVL